MTVRCGPAECSVAFRTVRRSVRRWISLPASRVWCCGSVLPIRPVVINVHLDTIAGEMFAWAGQAMQDLVLAVRSAR